MAQRKRNTSITTLKELKASYEKIWQRSDLVEEELYYRWIVSLWGDVKGKRLLDVGCGGGYLMVQAQSKGMEVAGLDISEIAVKKARKRLPKAQLVVGAAEKLPFEEARFDVVSCLGSLEHFLKPQKSLPEMQRVLKDEGLTCIVLPNRWAIDAILNGVVQGKEQSHGQELERFYTYFEAANFLQENGFFIEKSLGYNRPFPSSLATGTWLSQIADWVYQRIYRFLRWRIPVRLSYVFVFLLRKEGE